MRRTPWLDSGCNKPEGLSVEQAVEEVRDLMDGTRQSVGTGRPKARGNVCWERTHPGALAEGSQGEARKRRAGNSSAWTESL